MGNIFLNEASKPMSMDSSKDKMQRVLSPTLDNYYKKQEESVPSRNVSQKRTPTGSFKSDKNVLKNRRTTAVVQVSFPVNLIYAIYFYRLFLLATLSINIKTT